MSNKTLILYSTGCLNCQILEEELATAGCQFIKVTDVSKMLELGFDEVPVLEIAPDTYLNYQEALIWIGELKNEK